jgi:hypothetical protein
VARVAWLAGALHLVSAVDQVGPARTLRIRALAQTMLFPVLDLATRLFDAAISLADLDDLTQLTRVSLVLPTLAYQPATALENLRAEFRVHYGLPADAPVTTQDLRDLVAMMGQARARAQQAGAGPRPATRAGLSAVIRAH